MAQAIDPRLIRALMMQGYLPDPQAAEPPQAASPVASALVGGSPTVNMPVGRFGETEPRPAPPEGGFQVPQPPAFNSLRNFGQRVYEDVAGDPMGALRGLDAFGGLAGPMSSARTVFNPASRHMIRRELRSGTEGGMRKNLMEDIQASERYSQEIVDALTRHPDVVTSRAPHWQLQTRGKNGRFEKLADDVRAARERGVEMRARQQRAADRARNLNEGSN